mmetsp:Transcript_9594/g.27685  ORF Transcript_9594/g.27685 Transcript_9594/m.27685 type:complete len:212 (-) Transcript_9594:1120-1755(-)
MLSFFPTARTHTHCVRAHTSHGSLAGGWYLLTNKRLSGAACCLLPPSLDAFILLFVPLHTYTHIMMCIRYIHMQWMDGCVVYSLRERDQDRTARQMKAAEAATMLPTYYIHVKVCICHSLPHSFLPAHGHADVVRVVALFPSVSSSLFWLKCFLPLNWTPSLHTSVCVCAPFSTCVCVCVTRGSIIRPSLVSSFPPACLSVCLSVCVFVCV